MAALYGSIQGNRGEATRMGSKSSGIRSYVQTWDARVTVQLEADGTCRIVASDWQRGGTRIPIFEGNVHELLEQERAGTR